MAATRLDITHASAGNRQTMTFSFWCKISSLVNPINSSYYFPVFHMNVGADYTLLYFNDGANRFGVLDSNGTSVTTNRQFRDVNAWYAITVAIDTTQATASDRIKIYVNGVQETSLLTSTYPAQNANMSWNNNNLNSIGQHSSATDYYYIGLLSHVHFIDGIQYQASDFGEYDANGVWKIKTNVSVTYGNNGFFILKDGNSVTDQSGNSNNWTVGGGTLTNTEDCPSNVFPTINPLTYSTTKWNLEYGNLRTNGLASGESADWRRVYGTLGASSGKYYFEMKGTRTYSVDPKNFRVGIVDAEQMKYAGDNASFIDESRGYGYQATNGNVVNSGANTSYGNSYTTNDIIGCAFDLDNHKLYFSKNGTWQTSGDPTSGETGTGSAFDLATG